MILLKRGDRPVMGRSKSELDLILAARKAERRAEAFLIGVVICAIVTLLVIGILRYS